MSVTIINTCILIYVLQIEPEPPFMNFCIEQPLNGHMTRLEEKFKSQDSSSPSTRESNVSTELCPNVVCNKLLIVLLCSKFNI